MLIDILGITNNMKGLLLLWLCCFCNVALASRILVIPMQGKSHMIATNSIGQELKSNGHEVYTIAAHQFEGKENQIGAADLEILYFNVPEGSIFIDSEHMQKRLIKFILTGDSGLSVMGPMMLQSCENMLADDRLMERIQALKFDLAIVEAVPFIPCAYLLPHVFNIPYVTFLPTHLPSAFPGSVSLPSYTPAFLLTPGSMPMSFTERLISTLFHIAMQKEILPTLFALSGFIPQLNDISLLEKFKEKGMVSDSIRGWLDFLDETQLVVMANADLTFDYPKPLFPNVVSVEGLSVKEADPLSKEMEDLVKSSAHGIIVVSFGSNVQYLPTDVIIKMVNVFRKRKELFLMRYSRSLNGDNFVQPANVKFMSWLPQHDLLAHNKTRLFITHGGLNGLHEAVYQGVPMLCVPLFGDQPTNALRLEAKGFGLSFHLTDYTEDELLEKIDRIITNPSYREKTQRAGQIMRHRPMNARQTAAFWIEHVLRFGGEHLKPSSMHLTWWQFYCLDTLGVIVLVIVFVLFVIYTLIKLLVKLLFRIFKRSGHAKKD